MIFSYSSKVQKFLLRESDILINEINTLESILGRLSDLKYGDKARAIEIAESNNNYQQANR